MIEKPSEHGPPEELPVLPLRNAVLFPASVVPVNVGRARSVALIEKVQDKFRAEVAVVAQHKPETEEPAFDDLYRIGTVARVLKVIRLSSGSYSVVLQGICRMVIVEPAAQDPYMTARIVRVHESPSTDVEIQALATHLREASRKLIELLPHLPREAAAIVDNVQEAGALADLIASHLPVPTSTKQEVLKIVDIRERLRKVASLVGRQSDVHKVKREISSMVRREMSRSQREILLRQQLRSIRQELGEADEEDEIDELREKVMRAEMPSEVESAARKQLSRMRVMAPASGEYQIARSYVEWLTELPWTKSTVDRLDVLEARRVLDEDHHGLDRIKRRIVEYIAVRRLRPDARGPILCFVGPPGVGKTSLSRSIARATGRNFVRVALGGVQDEAEIRGHRRTYVGAYPGRIITGLKKAGSRNPVMLLDEVDKMANDVRGDPSSALLEVLDPEQNNAYVDHYIDLPVDLSPTLFIATANRKDRIPRALLDRMEVIELPGYTREEKLAIANQFLVPRQLSEHGLSPERLELSDEALGRLVDEYTREAGVRSLERSVAAICRSVAVRLADGEDVQQLADGPYVERVLGPPRHQPSVAEKVAAPGVSTALAWTPSGGQLLFVESTRMPGKGHLHLTGKVGDVMKESVAAAFTYIRARPEAFGLKHEFLSDMDVHVHLPDGAIPKDGPSGGVAIFVSLASMLTRLPVRPDVGMSGEMSLRGHVLRVDGIKEKLIAAHRAGLKHVLLPKRNEPDLDEVPEHVLRELKVHLVSRVEDVLPLSLDLSGAGANATPTLA